MRRFVRKGELMHHRRVSQQLIDALAGDRERRYDGACPDCLAPPHRPCRNTRGEITKRHDSRVAPREGKVSMA